MDIRGQTCVCYLETNRDGHGCLACGGISHVQYSYHGVITIIGKMLMSRVLQSIYSGKVLITNPDWFFAELSERDSNLLAPFVIVLITAVIPAIADLLYYFHTTAAAPVMGLVAPFIWWFLCTGAFYALSALIGGVGSFKRVLEFTGYGFVPHILSAIFNTVIIYTLLPLLASLPQFIIYVIAIISLLLFLWSVAIWVFAVKHSRNLSTQDALFMVASSVIAGLLICFVLICVIADIIH
ncbi:MAG TPA: YIP1 family protein [Methanosarcinales archaeon]|nr:YIP1 family protein [Methanosarcinales archaeon]